MAGMHSDVQGMAVVIEHIMRTLGGTKKDLYELFKELWSDRAVTALLRDGKIFPLSLRPRQEDWKSYMRHIDALRQGSPEERVVADLVLASRLRGDVHRKLPESDLWALEDLFATLIRAAVRTFAQVRAQLDRRPSNRPK